MITDSELDARFPGSIPWSEAADVLDAGTLIAVLHGALSGVDEYRCVSSRILETTDKIQEQCLSAELVGSSQRTSTESADCAGRHDGCGRTATSAESLPAGECLQKKGMIDMQETDLFGSFGAPPKG